MRRRRFIFGLGSAATAWPFIARAQQKAMPVIGYLSSAEPASDATYIAATREGLAQQGFVEGRNLAIEFRWGNGDYSRLPRLAGELIDLRVSLLMTSGLPATLAAKKASSAIPIVFRLAIDPVAFGLAQSLNRPGGNLTGVTMLFDPLTSKKLQLLHQLVPHAAAIGFLINPENQNAASHKERAQEAAQSLGLSLLVLSASNPTEIEAAFATAQQRGLGAVLVGDDPFFGEIQKDLVEAAARHATPTLYYVRDFTVAGGLISYGPSREEMARQAGNYAGLILNGANPAELPVRQPTKFELVINLKAAKTLGLAVPQPLLAQADEVIE